MTDNILIAMAAIGVIATVGAALIALTIALAYLLARFCDSVDAAEKQEAR